MKNLLGRLSGQVLLALGLFTPALIIVSTAWGAADLPAAAEPPVAPVNAWGDMIRAGATSGDGVEQSQATEFNIDLFFTLWGDAESLLFINPRARFSNEHSSNEYNFGLGYRSLVHDERAILGVNAFYDTMWSVNHKRYNQFGLGVEAVSKWFDFRSNLYLPFGTTEYEVSRWSDLDNDYTKMEEAPEGADAELGFMVPFVSDFMETHAYFGGYWYSPNLTDDLTGWKARLDLRPVRMLILGYEYRADSKDNEDNFFSGTLEIPFSLTAIGEGHNPFGGFKDALKVGAGPRNIRERMKEKVTRDRSIITVDVIVQKPRERCGNGKIETNEQCDDGNTSGADGCSSTCQAENPACGNGAVEPWGKEQCDDGNQVTEVCAYGLTQCRICNSQCAWVAGALSVCGDGIVNGPETCDDGNTTDGDGCNSTCKSDAATPAAVCGNNITEKTEQCDDGNQITEVCDYGLTQCLVCDAQCRLVAGALSVCGDGIINGPETCDDGNTTNGDGCSSTCQTETAPPAVCGNNIIEKYEECDDGNQITEVCAYGLTQCQVCDAQCRWVAGAISVCGDGIINGPETCDDGDENGCVPFPAILTANKGQLIPNSCSSTCQFCPVPQ